MKTALITSEFPLMRRFGRDADTSFDRFSPALEVVEKDNRFIVRADVPGTKRDDIKVEILGRELTIQGERHAIMGEDENGFYRSERSYGSFFRWVSLPDGVDIDLATATVQDGVLEVILPIGNTELKKRRIPIGA